MSAPPLQILLVEDEAAHAELVRRAFEQYSSSMDIRVVDSLAEVRRYLETTADTPALIIADWRLPDGEGLEIISIARAWNDIPVVLMTSHGNERVAVEAMRTGALDYVVKSDQTLLDMPHIAERALRAWQHIVERKRAEAALRESELRYRLITENANDLIGLLDRRGHFVYVSPSVQPRLGYEPANLIGQKAFDFIHPEDHAPVREYWARLPDQRRAQITCRYRHEDGSWCWLEVQGALIEGESEHYAVMVGRDVTERRLLEVQLYQMQKMDAIGQLAGGVAHDFNNLLVVISGYADLAITALEPDNPVQADLQEIQKAARRATNLTRQLLTFARRQINDPRMLNLNELILDMDKMLRRLIRENITLTTSLTPDLWPIWADSGQIEQVIMNLVLNARDAMAEGGRLTIETTNVMLDHEFARTHPAIAPGPHVRLAVLDTGIGMSEEIQRHAFEPFFTTKEPGRGTGLGLATCYGIIKQHGGNVYLQSEVGRGTCIQVYLPRTYRSVHGIHTPLAAGPFPHGDETVLLVEDEAAVRVLAARALRSHGYTVLEAENGTEALKIVDNQQERPLDLLLTDMVMPSLGGVELTEAIRARQPAIRVLWLSGYTDQTLVSNGLSKYGATFLPKPFTMGTLLHKVREVLDR